MPTYTTRSRDRSLPFDGKGKTLDHSAAAQDLADVINHMVGMGIDVIEATYSRRGCVVVTDKAIPREQVQHLGLTET